ncbi:hypothetical protein DT019_24725 [Streptomyces sp. SDr-06]|uniref:hypothetical protein n=1 Tax=Streptomyces sp. SDr-06 TaxID=2267702 RepID=UPI000DE9B319|nr:hypothetical protein [Streptomyces sp. SDr-06]RCH66027.1 hypothetical protein DT019_24725 [Streptomyces sp. SDr-06]
MKHFRRACGLLVMLAVAGCGLISPTSTSKQKGVSTDMNMQQAADKADALLQETVAGVTPKLRWVHEAPGQSTCTDWKNTDAGTGYVSRGLMVMTVVSPERRGSLLGMVERGWKGRGFTVTNVRADAEFPAVYASTPDGFRLEAAVGGEGQFRFGVTSPCAPKSPVGKPTTPSNVDTNTPAYEGGKPLPRPYLQDDFWSAPTPAP